MDLEQRLESVLTSDSNEFLELLSVAGLDVKLHLRGADLSKLNLRGADLSDADLSHANLREANLADAILSGANLRNADLTDAVLDRARVIGTIFIGADITRTSFNGVNIGEASFGRRGSEMLRTIELLPVETGAGRINDSVQFPKVEITLKRRRPAKTKRGVSSRQMFLRRIESASAKLGLKLPEETVKVLADRSSRLLGMSVTSQRFALTSVASIEVAENSDEPRGRTSHSAIPIGHGVTITFTPAVQNLTSGRTGNSDGS
jgi:uncharacterized protein YjbI with pentapeptide repeats